MKKIFALGLLSLVPSLAHAALPQLNLTCKVLSNSKGMFSSNSESKECSLAMNAALMSQITDRDESVLTQSVLCDLTPYYLHFSFRGDAEKGGVLNYTIYQTNKRKKNKVVRTRGFSIYDGVQMAEHFSEVVNGNGIDCQFDVK